MNFIQFIVALLNKSIIIIMIFLMTSNLCIMISTKVECDTKDCINGWWKCSFAITGIIDIYNNISVSTAFLIKQPWRE